jgi:superfamily I DNA/RNA helicase
MADFDSEFFIDYSSLDDFQRQLIDRKNNKSMVVSGSAGSGKSLIALHKAKQIASLGESYTIIVYTKSLRKYFEDGLKKLGLRNVFHYHQWKHNQHRVKYLIVDECQDFTNEEIEEMKLYGEYCLFFGDTAQSIMGFADRGETQTIEHTAADMGIAPDPLYFNYRLTKEVAALGEKIGNVEDLVLKCKRQGEKPNLIPAGNFDGQLDKIADIIKNRSLTNVGILLPFNIVRTGSEWSVEHVKDYLMQKGITCEFKYNANQDSEMDLDFHSSNPKIMTWWCAKGLQFKDVFIPGCDKDTDKRSALYVAMTRCSERLYLGYSGTLSSLFPQKGNSVYNNNDEIEII